MKITIAPASHYNTMLSAVYRSLDHEHGVQHGLIVRRKTLFKQQIIEFITGCD